jgi:very-short-patch-repair endonuclease
MKRKPTGKNINKIVLVGVVKDKRDLSILLEEKRYRIPKKYAPKKKFQYLAFYQPAEFGSGGKCIRYYARVLDQRRVKRKNLIPNEPNHSRAQDYYFKFRVGIIKKLPRAIRNVRPQPRRISFGFTTLNRLLRAKNILELYNIVPAEEIIRDALKQAGIKAIPQYYAPINRKRYYLDFAVFCRRGRIAIECDNKKSHSNLRQKEKDKRKNADLRHGGWRVIRLTENKITSDLGGCLRRVKIKIRSLGGATY